MARKSSKSVQEQLQEIENKRQRLATQAAMESGNPILKDVSNRLERVSKEIAGHSRFFNGSNSFENRREGFQLRLTLIQAEEKAIRAKDAALRATRGFLKAERDRLAELVANGENAENVVCNPLPEAIRSLYDIAKDAENERQAAENILAGFQAARKAKDAQSEIEAEA